MAKEKALGEIIIAGPGAGKTFNMVETILKALPDLLPCRYMVVITYTNSATSNIQKRLAKKITIPENLFIGTIHSFLNKFIVIPFSSIGSTDIGKEKLFMQCGIDDVFEKVEKLKDKEKRSKTPQDAAIIKSAITKKLNKLGYITFDQTLSIAKNCLLNTDVCRILSNRLQFLFVDEFQDSGNEVFSIIDNIRKQNKTKIYCVGDPEQYIQSFDSSIRAFKNIPILKAAESKGYLVQINNCNYRSTKSIVTFLNHFNGRFFNSIKFQQIAFSKETNLPKDAELGEEVLFIKKSGDVTSIMEDFYVRCDNQNIPISKRCILAKKNDLFKRIAAAVNNQYMNPKKTTNVLPLKAIQDTLLTTLHMNQTQFFDHYQTNIYTLRKHAVSIFKAINTGTISNEDSYGKFIKEVLQLQMKEGLPVKIENLKADFGISENGTVITISNIHTIKGLESEAVLAIAKTEEELLLWIETDHSIREAKRDNEKTDYPRLGYVAFSRAERLLCIACLEPVSDTTLRKLEILGVVFED